MKIKTDDARFFLVHYRERTALFIYNCYSTKEGKWLKQNCLLPLIEVDNIDSASQFTHVSTIFTMFADFVEIQQEQYYSSSKVRALKYESVF